MNPSSSVNRRQFLGATAATAAVSIVPRHVLGGAGRVAPNDRIHIGYVGCGTQGLRQLMEALRRPEIRVVAVCDPNRRSDDYPEWHRGELNEKIRNFLGDPGWAKDARGGLCGREVGLEVVRRHYTRHAGPDGARDCRAYSDFREMLEKERDLDAVYIMTPEHLHATVAIHAMRAGKHALTHKPIANVLQELRLARDTGRDRGLVGQLFCSADLSSTPPLREWIRGGVIGHVREVHNWSNRPFWPQGMSRPVERVPVPDGLDWDLWLGPVPHRDYHPSYTHAVFRGWYDFGTGALGDMGHYSLCQVFRILDLGSPISVEASRSQFWSITDYIWRKEVNLDSYPRASLITWEFPARGDAPPVRLHWYDGGLRPPTPPELASRGEDMPEEGLLFIGERGTILAGFSGMEARLLSGRSSNETRPPAATGPRPPSELDQFITACRGGEAPMASFEKAYPFSETILLGTIALRVNKKLQWDAARFEFTNSNEANALRTREYREGWKLT